MLVYIKGEVIQNNGISINFDKVVKNDTDLFLYANGGLFAKFSGIKNWDDFQVTGGEIVEDIDNDEILLENIMEMKLDNSKYVVEKKSILHELMEIKLKLMKGGL